MKPSSSPARVLLGTIMLSTANVSKIALQFLLLPILARLLGPKVFGLMSVAMSVVLFANMLCDGGMGAALVRIEDADHDLRSTVFWLSVLIGTGLAAIVCVMAWPLAAAFSQPELVPVLCALSPILVLSALLSVSNAQIIRTQRFDVFAAGDLGCAVASAATGIAMAFQGYGIWSLVGQQLVLWAAKAAWVISVTRFRPSFVLRLKLAEPLFQFSANNLAANVADFVGKSAPNLIVGGVLGIAATGHYSMGYQLTRIADMVVSNPINVATFSAVAVAANRHAAASFVMTALRILMLVLAPLSAGLMLTGNLAAPLLLGSKWIQTAPVLVALAPGSLLVCAYGFAGSALLGKGLSGEVLRLTLLTSFAIAAATFLGAHFGVMWAAIGFSLGAAMLAPAYVWRLSRAIQVSVYDLLSAVTTSLLAVAVMCVGVLLVRAQITGLAPIVQLIISIAVGVAIFGTAIFCLEGRQIREDIARLRGTRRANAQPASPTVASQTSEV